MILFKACPRCGGDVDTTDSDDVCCIQCGNRPAVRFPGPVIVGAEPEQSEHDLPGVKQAATARRPARPTSTGQSEMRTSCPRCESTEMVRLDKLRDENNTCFRCSRCGHIFSPATRSLQKRQRAPLG